MKYHQWRHKGKQYRKLLYLENMDKLLDIKAPLPSEEL